MDMDWLVAGVGLLLRDADHPTATVGLPKARTLGYYPLHDPSPAYRNRTADR